MVWIDTHAHLNMAKFNSDREAVIRRALQAGVTKIIDIGTDLQSSRNAVGLSRIFDNIYAVAGIHPHDAAKACGQDLEDLIGLLKLPKTVAVGETGLDYHYDFSPRLVQKDMFQKQLEISLDVNKPVVIHVREAMQDALDILDSVSSEQWSGVFHCFGGNQADAEEVLKRGFHISFTGVVTFKNFNNKGAVLMVPSDKLMLETDCPYMAPEPFRGKRCEPAHVARTGEVMAKIRDISVKELAETTTANAVTLFGLGN